MLDKLHANIIEEYSKNFIVKQSLTESSLKEPTTNVNVLHVGGPRAVGSVGPLSTPLERFNENAMKPIEMLRMMKRYRTV